MSGEVSFFELGAGDSRRTRDFFESLFGWRFEPGPHGGMMIDGAGLPGGVHDDDAGGGPYLFFAVDDLETAAARVTELGGHVEGQLTADDAAAHGRFVMCRDPEGGAFGLHQRPTP